MAEPVEIPQPVAVPEAPIEPGPTASNPPLPQDVAEGVPTAQSTVTPGQKAPGFMQKAARALFTGKNISYEYDDQGKLVTTVTKQKPGEMFRHMLAGALLGGAMGATDPSHTFAGGATRGGAAVLEHEEQQDALNRKQAQENYETRLKSRQDVREQAKVDQEQQKLDLAKKEQKTKDDLSYAQIAVYNTDVLQKNQEMQGKSLIDHKVAQKADEDMINNFKQAGLKPVFTVSEDEAHDMWTKRSDAGKYAWMISDVRMGYDYDSKGVPHATYKFVYSAYDVKGKDVQVTKDDMKKWNQYGVNDIYKSLFDRMKVGDKISVTDHLAFDHAMSARRTTDQATKTFDMKMREDEQKIAESKARAAHLLAEAAAAKDVKDKDKAFQVAMKNYKASGNNFDALNGDEQAVIAEHATKVASAIAPQFRATVDAARKAAEEGRKDEAASLNAEAQTLGQKLKDLTDLSGSFRRKVDTSQLPKPKAVGQTLDTPEAISAYQAYEEKFGPGHDAEIIKAMLANGWAVPKPKPTPPPAPGLFERAKGAVGSAIGTAKGVAGRAIGAAEEFLDEAREK